MNRVFVLGAGFSKHISQGRFPVMGELASELRQRFDWLASLTAGVNFDLEKLLTWIDLSPWPFANANGLRDPVRSRNELKG